MKAYDIMTADPVCVSADEPADRVARLMAENDCGCVPVIATRGDARAIGVVTDRDLVVRGMAHGRGAQTPVRELMTPDPYCCASDADVVTVERLMADRQVRRILVADADGCCVGIIAQADLARAAERGRDVTEREVALVVEAISEPSAREVRAADRRAAERGAAERGGPAAPA